MKECPICHTQYDDSMNFCVKDGNRLIDSNQPTKGINQRNVTTSDPPKKHGGCLKKVLLGLAVIVIVLVSFYKYIMNAATYLRTEPDQISFAKAGGHYKVDIDYDGYIWVINHKPDWVFVVENEKDLLIHVDANQTKKDRTGSITIQSGKLLSQITVKQRGSATQLQLSTSELQFSRSGGNKTANIETDGYDWKVSAPSWIEVTKGREGEAKILCKRNTGEYRSGTIVFREDHLYSNVYVTQGGSCDHCHGRGEITCPVCYGMGSFGYGMFYTPCINCGGDGRIQCNVCNGSGQRN